MDSLAPPLPLSYTQPILHKPLLLNHGFKLFNTPQLSASLKSHLPHNHHFLSSHFLRKPQLPLSLSPISSITPLAAKGKPEENAHFIKKHAENFALLLVGSLLFLGRFAMKPAFALTNAPKKASSSPVEEGEETQMDRDEVEGLYLKILEKNPRDVEALKVLLYENMKKGKTKEAVKYVEKLIDVEPDDVEWMLLQALSYELMGNFSKAKRLFKEILEERPLLLRALHGLALAMHKNHEGPAVFVMLNKALEVARREKRVTEERDIRILIAQMHVVKGELEEGLKKFQDLVNEDPRDFRPYLCQGIIYSLLDKKEEAEEQFQNYQSFVPQEFPQRGFLDDVVLAAKTESQEQLRKGV